jgi:hypothetical protein
MPGRVGMQALLLALNPACLILCITQASCSCMAACIQRALQYAQSLHGSLCLAIAASSTIGKRPEYCSVSHKWQKQRTQVTNCVHPAFASAATGHCCRGYHSACYIPFAYSGIVSVENSGAKASMYYNASTERDTVIDSPHHTAICRIALTVNPAKRVHVNSTYNCMQYWRVLAQCLCGLDTAVGNQVNVRGCNSSFMCLVQSSRVSERHLWGLATQEDSVEIVFAALPSIMSCKGCRTGRCLCLHSVSSIWPRKH